MRPDHALVVITRAGGVRRARAGDVAGLAAVCAYAWVVIAPSACRNGWRSTRRRRCAALRQAAGDEYRAFGIHPDYSSIGEIQDVEVVGPIATNEWVTFVDLIASDRVAKTHRPAAPSRSSTSEMRRRLRDLSMDYPRSRPLFDWVGVRYIVLDKQVFHLQSRVDQFALRDPSLGMRIAYEDEDAIIVESPTAQSKAFFTTSVREVSLETTLARLQADAPSTGRPRSRSTSATSRGEDGRQSRRSQSTAQTTCEPPRRARPRRLRRQGQRLPRAGRRR